MDKSIWSWSLHAPTETNFMNSPDENIFHGNLFGLLAHLISLLSSCCLFETQEVTLHWQFASLRGNIFLFLHFVS